MLIALFAALVQASAGPAPEATPDAAALAEMRAVSVSRVFPYWEDYLEMDEAERDRFTLLYEVRGPGDAALWLETAEGGTRLLAPDENGVVAAPDLAAFDRDAQIRVDAPPGAMSVSMVMAPLLEPTLSYEADALRVAAGQANAAMRRIAGVAALFAPRMDAVLFVFDGPAPDAWAISPDGERRALPVEQNRVWFPVRERAFRGTERVEFGAEPVRLILTAR
ncbi:MAG: hypothetical protein AAFX09_12000 [Pseudomonadota bacterium]